MDVICQANRLSFLLCTHLPYKSDESHKEPNRLYLFSRLLTVAFCQETIIQFRVCMLNNYNFSITKRLKIKYSFNLGYLVRRLKLYLLLKNTLK